MGKKRNTISRVSAGQWSNHRLTRWRLCETVERMNKEVRAFLGLVGRYRRFIPEFSSVAVPLTNLITKMVRNPVPWTEEAERAFQGLKESM